MVARQAIILKQSKAKGKMWQGLCKNSISQQYLAHQPHSILFLHIP